MDIPIFQYYFLDLREENWDSSSNSVFSPIFFPYLLTISSIKVALWGPCFRWLSGKDGMFFFPRRNQTLQGKFSGKWRCLERKLIWSILDHPISLKSHLCCRFWSFKRWARFCHSNMDTQESNIFLDHISRSSPLFSKSMLNFKRLFPTVIFFRKCSTSSWKIFSKQTYPGIFGTWDDSTATWGWRTRVAFLMAITMAWSGALILMVL